MIIKGAYYVRAYTRTAPTINQYQGIEEKIDDGGKNNKCTVTRCRGYKKKKKGLRRRNIVWFSTRKKQFTKDEERTRISVKRSWEERKKRAE